MDLHPDENPVVCCFPILHSIQPWRLCNEELINYDYIEDKDGITAINYCIKVDTDRMDGDFDLWTNAKMQTSLLMLGRPSKKQLAIKTNSINMKEV